MKKYFLLLVTPFLAYSDNLAEIIEKAENKNHIIQSNKYIVDSRKEDIYAVEKAYGPTINIGGSYQSLNEKTTGMAGDIYSSYANIGIDLYDGSYKSNQIKQNKALLDSSKYGSDSYIKTLQLSIAQDFYNIKSKKSALKALYEKENQLDEELDRIKKFFAVGSATKDDIDKLQAELSNNLYLIDALKHEILSLEKLFFIKVGYRVNGFDNSLIKEPINIEKETSDEITSLQKDAQSLKYSADVITSGYMPTLRLENSYNIYDYDRSDDMHQEGVDDQNKLMLSLNIKLFDNGVLSKQKESILYKKRALEEEIQQKNEEQDINIELSHSNILTSKAQIQSAKNSLIAASSAYETIARKFKVGIANNVDFLDALSVKTNAMAQYEESLNNLQIAYATYYFYKNKRIGDFIK